MDSYRKVQSSTGLPQLLKKKKKEKRKNSHTGIVLRFLHNLTCRGLSSPNSDGKNILMLASLLGQPDNLVSFIKSKASELIGAQVMEHYKRRKQNHMAFQNID